MYHYYPTTLLVVLFLTTLFSSGSATTSISNNTTTSTSNNNNHNNNNNNNVVFDINEAYTQLMYAYSAYCPESNIVNWDCFFCKYNITDTKGFKVQAVVQNAATNTYGYIGSTANTVEVVFRGTQVGSLDNWITDLDFAHTKPYSDIPNAYVHSGFLDAYDVVKVAVRKAVFTLVNSTKITRVVFTGHSLGAALTTLCALDIGPSLSIPFLVYNYGSPRVGNNVFASYYNSIIPNTIRVTNRADMVPHLPLKDMGFFHVAQEVWWNTKSHYTVCDTTGEDPKCCDSAKILSIPDHLDYMQIDLVQGGC